MAFQAALLSISHSRKEPPHHQSNEHMLVEAPHVVSFVIFCIPDDLLNAIALFGLIKSLTLVTCDSLTFR